MLMLRFRGFLAVTALLGFCAGVVEAGHGHKKAKAGAVAGFGPGPFAATAAMHPAPFTLPHSYPVALVTYGFPAATFGTPAVSPLAPIDCAAGPLTTHALVDRILDRYGIEPATRPALSLELDARLHDIETRVQAIEDFLRERHGFGSPHAAAAPADAVVRPPRPGDLPQHEGGAEIAAVLARFQDELRQQLDRRFAELDESVQNMSRRLGVLEEGNKRRDKAIKRLQSEVETLKSPPAD
jgi:hypothetical protein